MKTKIKEIKKKTKALVLFSGGLDSLLAVKILQENNPKLKIEAVFFLLPFIKQKTPKLKNIKTHLIDCTKGKLLQDYLKIIKNPKHGYGTSLNPCQDCKIFMLKQAKKLMKKINADFIATGEVLSQRPMSQLKHQLILIEKQAGLKGKILRPLSAKLLQKTQAEKEKLIDRKKLLDIQGRQRKIQIKIAKKYKIKYPNSGGGCLLCEREYAQRLKDLLKNKPINKIKPEEIQLLNTSRHFKKSGKIILGKNHTENQQLEMLNKKLKYNIIIPKKPGPTAIFENKKDKELAQKLINAYSKSDKSIQLRKKFEKLKID